MAVYAIDPSTTCMGWAVAERDGTVTDWGSVKPPRYEKCPTWRVS